MKRENPSLKGTAVSNAQHTIDLLKKYEKNVTDSNRRRTTYDFYHGKSHKDRSNKHVGNWCTMVHLVQAKQHLTAGCPQGSETKHQWKFDKQIYQNLLKLIMICPY